MASQNLRRKVLCCSFLQNYDCCDREDVNNIIRTEREEENAALLSDQEDFDTDVEMLPVTTENKVDWQLILKLSVPFMDIESFLKSACVNSSWSNLSEHSPELLRIIRDESLPNVSVHPLRNFQVRLLAAERLRNGKLPYFHMRRMQTTSGKQSVFYVEIFEQWAYTSHNEGSQIFIRKWSLNDSNHFTEWRGRSQTSAKVVKIIATSEVALMTLDSEGFVEVWNAGFHSIVDSTFKSHQVTHTCLHRFGSDLVFSTAHFLTEQQYSFPFVKSKISPKKLLLIHRDPESGAGVRQEQLQDVPFDSDFTYDFDTQDSALVILLTPCSHNCSPLVWVVHVDTAQVVWQIEVQKGVHIESVGFYENYWFSYNFSTCYIGRHDMLAQTTTLHHLLYNDAAEEIIGEFEGEDKLVPDQELFQKMLHKHYLIVFGPDEVLDEADPLSPMAFNIHIWDVRTMSIVRTIYLGPNYYSSCMSANDGHLFVIDGNLQPQSSNMTIWNIEDDSTSLMNTNFIPLFNEMEPTVTSSPGSYTLHPDELVFDDGKVAFSFCMAFHKHDSGEISFIPGGFFILDFCRASNVTLGQSPP